MLDISTKLAFRLVKEQFPEWGNLKIRPVAQSGHDNRTFHLGETMTIRLPSGYEYVPQIEKEAKWLPFLAERLSLPISCPVSQGKPTDYYPFPWSINKYIEGETISTENVPDIKRIAIDLSTFLQELQSINPKGAPTAGEHNFFRGASPIVYNEQVEIALQEQKSNLPTQKIKEIWESAIASEWKLPPVWIHGDIAPGNLLIKNGGLCGVIDFGIMGVGDPACDYAMAWTFFDSYSRKYFLQGLDKGTIDRARGWALWKALITYNSSEPSISHNAKYTINTILSENDRGHKRYDKHAE
ncbi:aminoglycoside phosphotransferase family protein [Paenibacillus popilliae]|uniref:Aminoglycoside phosphotransferase family protein n=1 Tax=Paenibacillus popilliae TaxID=78057 RepID=A0ABY3AJW0_PAEPP|nr:aminoglycoside phosphotransferase family protein [Paenibacillus sp. SDF0028]TQR42257.1 aminoglycoside phosphotransferase family protein [Paenibacillus sp. SDF0028]